MPSNIEVKARVANPGRFRRLAEMLSDRCETLQQEDTFFAVRRGRLKLRRFPDGMGELIFYERADEAGPKESKYWISKTQDPDGLLLTLGGALGPIAVVRKSREVFSVGQTRIHLDEVDDLGTFAELEVVIQTDQSVEEATSIATELMHKLEIDEADLIDGAYVDLISRTEANKPTGGDVQ